MMYIRCEKCGQSWVVLGSTYQYFREHPQHHHPGGDEECGGLVIATGGSS